MKIQKTSSFTDNEQCFIEAIVELSDALQLIKKLSIHAQKLVADGAGEQRLSSILNELKLLCDDAQEDISATGLSW